MPKSKALNNEGTSDRSAIASALRTLEAEAGGITVLSAA
ncbi:MAG: KpsF/GutQ family sugar-phosphate isomerase, partial [Rhizobiales bacterium]|nr:KpsF/GutQ family sugar-phosphate isomerase [Hyphomicrobiales bacterium]